MGKTLLSPACQEERQKHPHARGEDCMPLATYGAAEETPPRTWGRLRSILLATEAGRNTPTHVGKTWDVGELAHGQQKHPHARGEDEARKQAAPA